MIRLSVLACLLIFTATSCERAQPTPTFPLSQIPPAPVSPPVHLSGVVRDDDGPVSEALVSVDQLTTATDLEGNYNLTIQQGAFNVVATKDGYERAARGVHTYSDPNALERHEDLRIHRILRLTSGQSASITLEPADSQCGPEQEYACRRIRIVSPAIGSLVVSIASSELRSLSLSRTEVGDYEKMATTLTTPVAANLEMSIYVFASFTITKPISFTITTALE